MLRLSTFSVAIACAALAGSAIAAPHPEAMHSSLGQNFLAKAPPAPAHGHPFTGLELWGWTKPFPPPAAPAGDNKIVLEQCPTPHGSKPDLVAVQSILLTPNPPQSGKNLNITASGTLSGAVLPGATVRAVGRIPFVPISVLDLKLDLCKEAAAASNLTCPIAAGFQSISQLFPVPAGLPSNIGINIKIQASNPNGESILCLQGRVFLS